MGGFDNRGAGKASSSLANNVANAIGAGCVVDYDTLFGFCNAMHKKLGECGDAFLTVNKCTEVLTTTESLKGNKGDKLKSYMADVHGVTLSSIFAVLEAVSGELLAYMAEYLSEIDKHPHTRIDTNGLMHIKEDLTAFADVDGAQQDDDVKTALSSISDIVPISVNKYEFIYDGLGYLANRLEELSLKVVDLERAHSTGDAVTSANQVIDSAIAMVGSLLAQPASFKMNYDISELAKNEHVLKLVEDASHLNEICKLQAANFETNAEILSERERALAEEEFQRRQEIAKKWNTIVTIACGALSVAASVVLPGAGTIIVAGITGGITAAVSDMTASWATTGEINWASAGMSFGVGALVGTVSGLAGAASSMITKGANLGTRLLVDSATEFSTGMISRFTYGVKDSLVEGNSFIDSLNHGFDKAGDLKEMSIDLGSSAIGAVIDCKWENNVSPGLDQGTSTMSNSDNWKYIATGALDSGGKELVKSTITTPLSSFVRNDFNMTEEQFGKDMETVFWDTLSGAADGSAQRARKIKLYNDVRAENVQKNQVRNMREEGIEGIKSDMAGVPDYSDCSEEIVKSYNGKNTFTIEMTGDRERDKRALIEKYGAEYGVEAKVEGYSWHHTNYNIKTGTVDMQLVKKEYHTTTIKNNPDGIKVGTHTGPVSIYKRENNDGLRAELELKVKNDISGEDKVQFIAERQFDYDKTWLDMSNDILKFKAMFGQVNPV